ncbi:unnamed protein product [Wuchereria bancrofti]|uniref:Uncharacterized protein n=1 Tax=Wuchereria bancrofti TaxID=6293 RepID=A0A3P7FHP3_WUCBA|nr:unnamed protein product [Wuchereria bancrofti]
MRNSNNSTNFIVHRSIIGGTEEVAATCASSRNNQESSTSSLSINQSINQRASLITDMFADTGYTGNTLADQLQLSRFVSEGLKFQNLKSDLNFLHPV